jgi:uncharacterized membrane-anchored protein YhcB (DUF1043 family)
MAVNLVHMRELMLPGLKKIVRQQQELQAELDALTKKYESYRNPVYTSWMDYRFSGLEIIV